MTPATPKNFSDFSIKLNADQIREHATAILAAGGHELVRFNGRSNFMHVRASDGSTRLLFTWRKMDLYSLRQNLTDASLFDSKRI